MINKKNVVCIIPARGGSKGIKNKNILPLSGKPLIIWTILQAKQSKYIDDIFVSTNCERISRVCEENDTKIINRPKEISGDKDSSEAALKHSIDFIKKEYRNSYDIIVFLQCTSPLRKEKDIDNALEKFDKGRYDSMMSMTKIDDLTIWNKKEKQLSSINFNYRSRGMRQDRSLNYIENGSIYILKPNILKKYNNRLGGKIGKYEMNFWQTWELDTYEELDLIEFYMGRYVIPGLKSYFNEKNIEFIAFDFDGVLTDNTVLVDENGKESAFVNRSDGLAISMLKKMGYPMAVISTEKNNIVKHRCNKLELNCYNGVKNKLYQLKEICKENQFELKNVIFVGNDLNDKEVMLNVGYPICPSDAYSEIKSISKIVLKNRGGHGIVRELLDYFYKD